MQTPTERQKSEIVAGARAKLLATVLAALREADETASAALRTKSEEVPSLHGYFTSCVHQALYCLLCGADPETFAGGNADTAIAIIRNSQQIAKHHWGADIAPHPRP